MPRRRTLLPMTTACLILALLASAARANVLQVPVDYPTIGQAVSVAAAGDTVNVGAGTYPECGIFLKPYMRLQGAGARCSVVDAKGFAKNSIIIFGATDASVEGFAILGDPDSSQTGIFCYSTPMHIRRNLISGCHIAVSVACSAVIERNIITSNSGYGIFCGYNRYQPNEPGPFIVDNLVAASRLQAIACVSSNLSAQNNTIVGSQAGIWIQQYSADSTPTIATVENNIVVANNWYGLYASSTPGYAVDTSMLMIEFNDVWGTASADYGGLVADSTDISANPLFVSGLYSTSRSPALVPSDLNRVSSEVERQNDWNELAAHTGWQPGENSPSRDGQRIAPADSFDFNLNGDSPCIDSGNSGLAYSDANGTRNDMGAYPFLNCGDIDASGVVDISDVVFVINYIFGNCGQEPQSRTRADVDCSLRFDVTDGVYLISYIFGGGPAPCAACP